MRLGLSLSCEGVFYRRLAECKASGLVVFAKMEIICDAKPCRDPECDVQIQIWALIVLTRDLRLAQLSRRKLHGDRTCTHYNTMTQTDSARLARYNKQLRGWLSYAFARYCIPYRRPAQNVDVTPQRSLCYCLVNAVSSNLSRTICQRQWVLVA